MIRFVPQDTPQLYARLGRTLDWQAVQAYVASQRLPVKIAEAALPDRKFEGGSIFLGSPLKLIRPKFYSDGRQYHGVVDCAFMQRPEKIHKDAIDSLKGGPDVVLGSTLYVVRNGVPRFLLRTDIDKYTVLEFGKTGTASRFLDSLPEFVSDFEELSELLSAYVNALSPVTPNLSIPFAI